MAPASASEGGSALARPTFAEPALSGPAGLEALFRPRRVAVVGASDTPGTPGNVLWRNLATFPGELVAVSRSAAVGGRPAYPRLSDLPEPVDLAVVTVPARAAVEVVADAATAGVAVAVVVSAGFAEAGPDGVELQRRLLAAADGRVRLIGPNCLGVQNCDLPLNASLAGGAGLGGGGISVITQSGSYAMAVSAWGQDESVRFARCVSIGNAADVGPHELLAELCRDGATRVACFFLESLSAGREFLAAAAAATSAGVRVLVAAVGRSPAGARSAASHTAALSSDRSAWESALASVGALVTRSGREMLDAARVLDAGVASSTRRRVGIVTNSGGTGTELTDLLAAEGWDVPELSPGLQQQLAAVLPGYASARNPVDMTPVWPRYGELYPACTDALARSDEVDVVVPVLLHRAAQDPAVADGIAATVGRLREDRVEVPVVGCWVAGRDAGPQAATLGAAGVPCLDWPDRTARALGDAARAVDLAAAAEPLPALSPLSPLSAPAPAPAPLPEGLDAEGVVLRDWLAGHGVPVAETRRCRDPEQAVGAAVRLGLPVVLKVDHPALSHKSDVGGVRVGLADPDEIRAAAAELLALAPGAAVLVQPVHRGVELIVGAVRDPVLGPLVAVGLGGVLVEFLRDVGFAPVPVTAAGAERLLDRLRGRPVLAGLRGAPPVDLAALTGVIVAVSELMARHPQLAELDLNPVLATEHGCVAVDWRVRLGPEYRSAHCG